MREHGRELVVESVRGGHRRVAGGGAARRPRDRTGAAAIRTRAGIRVGTRAGPGPRPGARTASGSGRHRGRSGAPPRAGRGRPVVAPGPQPERHGPSHQPRTRRAPRGGRRGDGRGGPLGGEPRDRPHHRQAGRTRHPCRGVARPADRSRGGDGGEQQCGRGPAGSQHPGARPGGPGVAGRAHRDRRLLPAPRDHEPGRLPPGRGGDHQPDPPRRLRPRHRRADRGGDDRAHPATTSSRGSPPPRSRRGSPPSRASAACRGYTTSGAAR